MTRVRFERRMASPTCSARPGDILDLDAEEAARRVAAGQCTYVDAPDAPGTAEDDGQKPGNTDGTPPDDVVLEKLTVEQLKAYATEREISLDGTSKKAEILDAITTELARREAEADDGDGDGGA